jgi:PadR family transcriptional regulator PadR
MARDITRGDIPTLILAVLAEGPSHGYAIARKVEAESANALQLREGSLYPALRELERQGRVESAWEVQESGPARKTYTITPEGRAELAKRAEEWRAYTTAVDALLGKWRSSHV